MTSCIFCKIIAGDRDAKKVFEDDQVIVIRDIHPKAKIHLLIMPKQHLKSLNEVTSNEAGLLTHMLLLLPKLAQSEGLNNGFRTMINTGPGGGQEIDHLHFHLLGGGLPF
jgi:histidine triad (HIT) family protein